MLKKEITYTDYKGEERTEEFFFHMNKAEVVKWLLTSGDYTLDKVLDRLRTERNGQKIMDIFEDLIHRSYGRVSLDGRKFEKSEEIWQDFYQTEAYSNLFMEVVCNAKNAAEFVNSIIPKDITDEINRIIKENPNGIPDEVKDYLITPPPAAPLKVL